MYLIGQIQHGTSTWCARLIVRALQDRMTEAGIGTLIHYPIPPHMQKAYAGLGIAPKALPTARQLADDVMSLPMGPHLHMTEVLSIISEVRNAV